MGDRYAVIGNPVAHSMSPTIHAQFARATGQDMEYGRIEAPLEGFAAAVEAFRVAGGKGLNVTLPFKREAWAYCARLSARARAAQAVNTLLLDGAEPFGDNTDGVGLARDLTLNLGFSLNEKRVLVMGAGGAAQGVIGELIAAGVAKLVIANRTVAKAQALAARHPGTAACGYGALASWRFDLVVNATSAGLAGEAPALGAKVFAPEALAYDMVYGRDTPFLALARAAGVRACDGLGMLVEQAAESFFLWRGVRPDTRAVLARLRAR
jgi:shikimate dehydrogenase